MDVLLAEFGESYGNARRVVERVERVLQATDGFTDQRQNPRYRLIVYSDGTTTVKTGVVGSNKYATRVEIQPPNNRLLTRLKRVHKALQPSETDESLWPDR